MIKTTRNHPWSPEDDALFAEMWNDAKQMDEMSKALKRTGPSLTYRREVLKLTPRKSSAGRRKKVPDGSKCPLCLMNVEALAAAINRGEKCCRPECTVMEHGFAPHYEQSLTGSSAGECASE
jgi:hypothetical protein